MPPHPATMITTVFVSESPAISHVVDLHFASLDFLDHSKRYLLIWEWLAQEKQLPLEQLSCSKGKMWRPSCHNFLVFFAETGQFRRVFLDRLDRSVSSVC